MAGWYSGSTLTFGVMSSIATVLQALNDSMFGNTECYEGEGLSGDDDEYAPDSKRPKHHSDSE